MASFIGSNLQSLHYNFKHKVAGSTVENPLKIYSGSVNPSNLPAPTSNEWKEIKNQNFIDKLGQQDGNTVVETTSNSVLGNIVSTNAPCDGMMNIEIGGNTRYKRADGTYTDVWESGCTLESVGEAEGNKIEVLNCGKNKFNLDKYIAYSNATFASTDKNTSSFQFYGLYQQARGFEFYFNTENKYYTVSATMKGRMYIAYKDSATGKEVLVSPIINKSTLEKSILTTSVSIPNNVKKVYVKCDGPNISDGSICVFKNIQIEEGTTATPYEPYKEDKINILNTVLRGFNNVRDLASGDTVTRKIGKRAYQTGDETNSNVLTDKVNTLYVLDNPTIEKLPQPLTLQSFANGTLQVNTAIPAYIKEYHTTNPDDQGVMQYQSGTTGLSQAFLTQIPLTSITNDIFGGSLPALKSAYKLTSNCDISAYGSGSNNGVETNNISYKVWNGTEYVLLNTNTSNVVSNINNILNNNNYVVDNNIYILMYTLPASDTIKSQINLDYFNANIDITRQPDNVIIPDTVKNTYIPTNYTIFAKIACLKTDNKKVIAQYFKDTNNYIELNIENNKINFIKCINGVITTLSSNVLDYNKYQVVGIVAQQQNTGMKLSVLKNNGECEHFSNTDVNILNVATEWKLGHDINITNQLDGFVVDYQFANKTFTNTECEVMLKGRNTTGDITYNSFVKDYQNGKIQSGFILPNNKYKIIGQVKLYYNDVYIRTVENCEFVAKDDENKVELVGMAEMVRVD